METSQARRGRPPRFYTASEVAPKFHKSPQTIYRWAKQGKIPSTKDPGGFEILFEASRIDQLVDLMVRGLL